MTMCFAQKAAHGFLTTILAILWLRVGIVSLFLVPAVLFVKLAVEIPQSMVYNVPRKEGI